MPPSLSYPGIYVEEVPSGVHSIAGVCTSVTAFIGRARWGPTGVATAVCAFDEFVERFGAMWVESTLSYAVRDFFVNGGSHAVIVRVASDAGTAAVVVGDLVLEAASPGSWGTELRVTVDHRDIDVGLADQLGVEEATLFNLTVRHAVPGGRVERFSNLSTDDNARNVATVLERESRLLRASSAGPAGSPPAGESRDALSQLEHELGLARTAFEEGTPGASDAVAAAEIALRDAIDGALVLASDGRVLTAGDLIGESHRAEHAGLFALDQVDLFGLLCIPPHQPVGGDLEPELVSVAMAYCESRRAILLVDPRDGWEDPSSGREWIEAFDGPKANAALFFPRLRRPDTERGGLEGDFAPSGAVAGVLARIDDARGVWKAAAGLDATLVDVPDLSVQLSDHEIGLLNPLGINCLCSFAGVGPVVWGARTLAGADAMASEWKYLPTRRLALFIEESLHRGTQWVVFEPNDEPLWSNVRLSVGSFMHDLFRQGAFQGRSARDAYFVKCDRETTTEADRNHGIVNIVVGFAPLLPNEFIVIRLQQIAGQIDRHHR